MTVESKVLAGAGGAGVGVTMANLVIWGVDHLFLDGSGPEVVPDPILQAIWYLTPLCCAYAAAWLAPHTRRPDLEGRHEQRQTIAERRAATRAE